MGSCWSGASNDDTADKTLSGKDAITEADVKVVSVGKSENLGGQPSKDGHTSRMDEGHFCMHVIWIQRLVVRKKPNLSVDYVNFSGAPVACMIRI